MVSKNSIARMEHRIRARTATDPRANTAFHDRRPRARLPTHASPQKPKSGRLIGARQRLPRKSEAPPAAGRYQHRPCPAKEHAKTSASLLEGMACRNPLGTIADAWSSA